MLRGETQGQLHHLRTTQSHVALCFLPSFSFFISFFVVGPNKGLHQVLCAMSVCVHVYLIIHVHNSIKAKGCCVIWFEY